MVRNGTSEIELADDLARYSKLRGLRMSHAVSYSLGGTTLATIDYTQERLKPGSLY